MRIDRYEHGVPSWADLGSPDPAKAAEFYAGLFGWECPEGPPESGGYRVCTLDGATVAGIGPLQNPQMPTVWTTYVDVADADATAELVAANGGMVFMPPMDVMTAGRMAIFADPTGAVFGVWQAGEHTGAQVVNEPGSICWSELTTTDTAAAADFYAAVFGWSAEPRGADTPMPYTEFELGGRSVGGMMPKPAELPPEVPSHWATYFAVADADETAAKARELGGMVFQDPMDIEPGRFAVLSDPTGGFFRILAMKAELLGS